jgi:hypothetical protein
VVIAILCVATNYVNAQSYSTAIGVKGGYLVVVEITFLLVQLLKNRMNFLVD